MLYPPPPHPWLGGGDIFLAPIPHGRNVGDYQILVGNPHIFIGDVHGVSNSTPITMIFSQTPILKIQRR